MAALVLPIALRPTSFPIKAGDVSSTDIQSPKTITYTSDVLTEQARQSAENTVAPVYLPADPSIARHQIEQMSAAITYVTTVRFDAYSSQGQKLTDLSAMNDLHLSLDSAERILALSDNRWQAVQQEALNVLEQVMRNTIRDTQVEDAKHSVPTLISFSLPQDQASIVSELATAFIVPNSLYSPDQTAAVKKQVSDTVKPVTRTFMAGETIVSRGQIITPSIWEALNVLGLVQPTHYNQDMLAAAALVLLTSGFIALYFMRRNQPPMDEPRSLILIAITFLLFLYGARFLIPNRAVLPYLYPIPAFGLTIAALFNVEVGLVLSLVLSVLAAYGLPNSLDLTLFYVLSSLCGVLVLGYARRVANFFWAGVAIGVSGAAVILAYRLTDLLTDWIGIATLVGAAFFNGLASASLTMLFQFLFAQLLGKTTALQLMEISRPDQPLLQFILHNAPGTYQHTLQVANLAEQAAERIGADALLTRVGAIYHDAGKALNPSFFIENQVPTNLNPHDDLDPTTSAATIIQHVTDGLLLARRYRLPPRIRDFIREHHGTLLTRYQYNQAIEAAGGDADLVDKEMFRYPGPRPQSRETALLMLADGCEARARAELPKDEEELRKLIKSVFDYLLKEGQLDDTRLTLSDLSKTADLFTRTLQGIYHPRIRYPELKMAAGLPVSPIEKTRPLAASNPISPEPSPSSGEK